jgi:transcriptional regulator with XRE-family HTH domain
MTLDAWLTKHRMTQADFAKEVGSNIATISRVRRGIGIPRLDIVKKIVDYTKNEVSLDDLVDGAERGLR